MKEEVKAKCATKFVKMKRQLAGRDEQDGKLLTLSQVFGTYDCLKVLAGYGLLIPEALFEKLSVDQMKWEAELYVMDVVELEDGDLEMSPPLSSSSRDLPTDLPSGVNQHGTNAEVIFHDDAANLRDQPES